MIVYKPAKMAASYKKTEIKKVIAAIGNKEETKYTMDNQASKTIGYLLGPKAEKMFGETLEDLKANPQQFSLVFKDKGLRMRALQAISEKARTTDFPTQEIEVYNEFSQYMEYCQTFFIPPSLGMFAVWCGGNIDSYNKHIKQYNSSGRTDTAIAMEICKETIRGFLETKAIDGDIAPAVYLHQNKAYYNAVETSAVRHETINDTTVRDEDQIAEVIDLIPDDVKREAGELC